MEFEKVFPELCAFGKYQKLIFFFVLLPAQLSYYLHIYSHIFMTYQPPHWCKIDHLVDSVVSSSQSSLRHQHNRAVQSLDMTPWFQSGSLRNNEMLQRYFFIPSKLDHQVDSHLVNMSDLLFRMNYSLVNYVESLSSCTVFNASSEQLAPFQHGLFQLFLLVLLSNRTANEVVLSSQLLDKAQNLIVSPPAVACTEWTFNRTWFGADESIVTRVSLIFANLSTFGSAVVHWSVLLYSSVCLTVACQLSVAIWMQISIGHLHENGLASVQADCSQSQMTLCDYLVYFPARSGLVHERKFNWIWLFSFIWMHSRIKFRRNAFVAVSVSSPHWQWRCKW